MILYIFYLMACLMPICGQAADNTYPLSPSTPPNQLTTASLAVPRPRAIQATHRRQRTITHDNNPTRQSLTFSSPTGSPQAGTATTSTAAGNTTPPNLVTILMTPPGHPRASANTGAAMISTTAGNTTPPDRVTIVVTPLGHPRANVNTGAATTSTTAGNANHPAARRSLAGLLSTAAQSAVPYEADEGELQFIIPRDNDYDEEEIEKLEDAQALDHALKQAEKKAIEAYKKCDSNIKERLEYSKVLKSRKRKRSRDMFSAETFTGAYDYITQCEIERKKNLASGIKRIKQKRKEIEPDTKKPNLYRAFNIYSDIAYDVEDLCKSTEKTIRDEKKGWGQ